MLKKQKIYSVTIFFGIILLLTSFYGLNYILNENSIGIDNIFENQIKKNAENFNLDFNGTRAFEYLEGQVNIGFRPPNSTELEKTREFIVNQLLKFNWVIEFHNFTYNNIQSANILAFPSSSDRTNISLFGAHYDTRWFADRDILAENKNKPVLGANDGASGVAVLMEFAQIFADRTDIGLLFIDAEDQGSINGWEYIAGSQEFTKTTTLDTFFPNGKDDIRVFILLDMIGDWQLNIKKELNSNTTYITQIWSAAKSLNYANSFIDLPGYQMTDDHIPFLNAGIPAVDLIDFDYTDENGSNLHHTSKDNLNYVSDVSLWIVGQTLEQFLKN
jgi:Zn-dependent M28 family amino/carboxypeptidase